MGETPSGLHAIIIVKPPSRVDNICLLWYRASPDHQEYSLSFKLSVSLDKIRNRFSMTAFSVGVCIYIYICVLKIYIHTYIQVHTYTYTYTDNTHAYECTIGTICDGKDEISVVTSPSWALKALNPASGKQNK